MNSIKSQAGVIRELLDSAQSVGIIIGENQNIDSVGAALALFLALSSSGKNVQVVSRKEPTVEVSTLVGIDRVTKSFDGNTKILTISVPYREGEIEKVSYNIEGTRLNVNLFAENSGITFNERDIEYIKKGTEPELIVTVGVQNEAELASFVDIKNVKTIHIDKSPLNMLMGDVVLVDPTFSSLSEIVAELTRELSLGNELDVFQNLLDGIMYATRNFTNPATSAYAFESAGFLMQNGARRKETVGQPRNENQRRDDRPRNFPREDQFLNQKPRFSAQGGSASGGPRGGQTNRPQNSNMNRPSPFNPIPSNPQNPVKGWQPRPQMTQPPVPQSTPKEMTSEAFDRPDEAMYTEGSTGTEVPDDWFLPKVFKGTRKGN